MNFIDVVPPILVEAEGCPEAMAVDALREAVIEFCRESYGWQTGVSVMSDAASTGSLNEIKVIDICDASIGGEPICVTFMNDRAIDEIDAQGPFLRFADPDSFDLYPSPAAPVLVDLLVIATPSPNALTFPDHIWREWSECLRHGALARLFASTKKPWSDYKAADYHRTLFDRDLRRAAISYQRNRRNHGRTLTVKRA